MLICASKSVNAIHLAAGSVDGNLASGTVPEVNCVAFKAVSAIHLKLEVLLEILHQALYLKLIVLHLNAVKLLPLFATMFPLESSMTDFDAGKVTNTFFVPAAKSTALSEFDDDIIVVLAKVPAPTVPNPTSNSPLSVYNCIVSCICISNCS